MNYQEMSNEELHGLILKRFSKPYFKEVTDDNCQTVIAVLEFHENGARRSKNVQS